MEIHIRLAGVQLGPYSEKQVREYLSEGLLSLTDQASLDETGNWTPVSDLLAELSATGANGTPEAPKRAPSPTPGVPHLSPKQRESGKVSLPSVVSALSKTTVPIGLLGPTAPTAPSVAGKSSSSTMTTGPLLPTQQGTKKVARASLVKALSEKTGPLPTRPVSAPSNSASGAPPVPAVTNDPPAAPNPENASLSSVMRALTAKTVPLKPPLAPAFPPAASSSITAPLPTRSIKPPSGTVSPPSVTKVLSKKLGRVSLPEAQTSPPTLGLPSGTGSTPPPAKIEEPPVETAAGDESDDRPSSRIRSLPIIPFAIYSCAALAFLALFYVWSPYHAASSLKDALNQGDPDQLNGMIDFAAVRASLKDQVKDQINHSGISDQNGNSAASSAISAVLSMMNNSIDFYITPEGISALVKKSELPAKDGTTPTVSTDMAAAILEAFNSQPVKKQGLASFSDFVVETDATMLHLQFHGLGWKLNRIDLRPGLPLPGAGGNSSPSLISPVVDTYEERGEAELQKGNWDGAIAEFTQILAIDPQSSKAYCNRALARQSKGDVEGALADYTQAIKIDPKLATAYLGRGNAKTAKNDLDGAIADFTQAIQIDPKMASAYDCRGNAKTAKGDLEGAISDYTEAITLDPTLASAYSNRGFARQANGNLDGAIADYTQALVLNPKTAVAYYNRGLAKQSQGNLDAAILDYDRALLFDPKLAGAYYNRGNAKNANHDLDGAIADYTEAVTLNPKIALAYCNRGLARQAKGDLDGAIADYTQALAIDPKIAMAYYDRGLIKEQKGDLDGAIADSSQAIDLDPKNAQAYYTRGFAKLIKGNLDGAMTDLKQFCDLAPTDRYADHARLYLWLIAKAQNSKTDPDLELAGYLQTSWNSAPDDLTSKTAAFLLGRINEDDFLAAASSTDGQKDQSQHCEAWYFAGMKRLLAGDRKTAIDYFHKCLATGETDYCEYILAQAELQALEPAASPTPPPLPAAIPATPAAKP
jgi:tetratricopeptide (TPR) repeat protein